MLFCNLCMVQRIMWGNHLICFAYYYKSMPTNKQTTLQQTTLTNNTPTCQQTTLQHTNKQHAYKQHSNMPTNHKQTTLQHANKQTTNKHANKHIQTKKQIRFALVSAIKCIVYSLRDEACWYPHCQSSLYSREPPPPSFSYIS